MKIILLKGNEATGGTSLGAASTVSNARLVKFYHTAAAVVTIVDSANAAIGNTSVEAGTHYFAKDPSDKIFVSAGLVTPVGFGD
jgi:hypothetical protein|tara:strand:- start:561 stop:812 length:252 start_codon:yes stop_codon:yes gene_type:complete